MRVYAQVFRVRRSDCLLHSGLLQFRLAHGREEEGWFRWGFRCILYVEYQLS